MSRILIIFFTLTLFISSCDQTVTSGYKRLSPGLYFKLYRFGDDRVEPEQGDLITVNISYSTIKDSVFFRGTRKIRLEDPGFPGSVYECLLSLRTGDSATFIFKTQDFFVKNLRTPVPDFLNSHKRIKMNILVSELQKSYVFLNEKKQFLEWSNKLKETDKDVIERFLEEEKISVTPTPSGLYFILLKAGNGRSPVSGDIVRINYEGRFLDGEFFDSTLKHGEPLEFIYDEEYMVIKGIEEAISMMREGDKALIIVPSDLAFGSAGAGEGIIPPYATLIYEIELLLVSKKTF